MIRPLQRREWPRVEPLFRSEFSELPPPPDSAIIVVVEEEGEIVAFTVLQVLQVLEPTWVRPDRRGPGAGLLCWKLFNYVRATFDPQYFFSHTKLPGVGKLLRRWGMEKLPMETYRWIRPGEPTHG